MTHPLDRMTDWEIERAREFVEAASMAFGAPVDQIYAHNRTRHVSDARHAAASALSGYAGLTLTMAGAVLGRRNHTTVLNSIMRAGQLYDTDWQFRERYEAMLALLGNPAKIERADPYEQMLSSGDGSAHEPTLRGGGR